ncbi:PAS domain-containing protein [Persicitalea sp.]|uniref:PAS domain-containing protein n=1 Tax=Persicitalea sp. TaxID=3100273 RepID=UPI003593C86E
MSDAFVSVDFDWNVLYLNSQTVDWSTQSRDEIIGRSLWGAFPMLLDSPLYHFCQRCMKSREAESMEYFAEEVNTWYYIWTRPTSRGMNIFVSDITDNKKIAENQAQFLTMVNAIPQLGWMATRDGYIHWYNDRWYEYTGTTLEEMEGWGWQMVHHPDHVAQVVAFASEAWQNDEPWELTFPLRGRDGYYRWFLTRVYPVKDKAGKVQQWIGTNTDINDQVKAEEVLKQSEAQLRQMSDFMPQLVWTTDAEGYHDFFNERWYQFTGLTFEETKDTGWAKLLHPADVDRTWKVWNHCLETGERYETEYRMRRADGVYRWLLARATPLTSETGEITHWFGTCTDIHDQKIANDTLEQKVAERTGELEAANEHLRRVNDELQQFNYIASHDLQEPVRKIKIFSERIKIQDFEKLSSGSQGSLDRIMVSVDRMSNLLKDLLDFSRVSREELFTQVNLDDIVANIESDLELLIAQKSATIQKTQLPLIEAIPLQMHQLFYNLINNAVKFAKPERPPIVRISCAVLTGKDCKKWGLPTRKKYFQFSIQDNGIGFEPQYAEKIFELFKRLHNQEAYRGTGVGLALCKKVVENHRGRIWAESEQGKGAAFHVILPLKQ